MKVVKTTELRLTPGEVTSIIKEHFKAKGINIETINYKLGVVPISEDWRGEYAANEELRDIICTQRQEHEDTIN